MARTKLRQLEQIKSSFTYDDQLNMGPGAEAQPSATIGSSQAIVSTTANTIVVAADLAAEGVNADDKAVISGSASNDGEYTITAISYSAPNTTLTVEETIASPGGADGNVQVQADDTKNLSRDLDFIRTQLRKLNGTANWYDEPLADDTVNYELVTGSAVSAGTDVVLGSDFDAGEPYTLKVFLNGQLLLPSSVSSNVVVSENDYIERNASQPVGLGEIGNRVSFAFDLEATDIVQFKWSKQAS